MIFSKRHLKKINPVQYGSAVFSRKRPKTGLAPGSLIHTGVVYSDKITIDVMDYSADHVEEVSLVDMQKLCDYHHPDSTTWVNVQGVHDTDTIRQIGESLGLHLLTQEDIVDINQRPKAEQYDNYLYIALKMINYVEDKRKIEVEQVSLILHQNYVLCFQERPGDVFEPVRKRIRDPKSKARARSSDYLCYMLLDVIIDYYYETLDQVWLEIERLEELVVRKPERIKLREIQMVRKDMIQLRRYMHPVKDLLHALLTRESEQFRANTRVYMRDTYDHMAQVVESLDTYREVLTSVMELYLSQLSIKMNEVMKVLTLIATIFIPLTFIAGIYGMNFSNMPEMQWEWAYPEGFYGLIGAIVLVMLVYMKRRRWL